MKRCLVWCSHCSTLLTHWNWENTQSPFLFDYLWLIEMRVEFLFSRENPVLERRAGYCKAEVVSSQAHLDFCAGLPCWVWEWQLSTARAVVTCKCITVAPWGNNQLPASKSKERYLVTGECKLIIHSLYRESKHAILLSWFEVSSHPEKNLSVNVSFYQSALASVDLSVNIRLVICEGSSQGLENHKLDSFSYLLRSNKTTGIIYKKCWKFLVTFFTTSCGLSWISKKK